ncbi:hypothetical protein PIB30_105729, partial [Stylosanthes scabra]|nr:hypothetical protein [Stylosanthes scabra]
MTQQDDNLDEHPSALDALLGMKILFKLNIKTGNIDKTDHVYPIMKICDAEDMIKKYQPIEFDTNPCDVGASNSVDVSGVAVNLESDIDTQPIGGTPEDSITSLKCKTPSKRANSSLKSCIQGKDKKDSGKMSTNRFSKKGQKKPLKR